MQKCVTFTREQLYELVWQKPVYRIADEYDISDVGLAKICARHDIPRPGRGYWAKPERKRPKRVPLPPSDQTSTIELGIRPPVIPRPLTEATAATNPEKPKREPIVVAEHLHRPCLLVQEARTALQGAAVDEYGRLVRPRDCLDVQVSRGQLSRALRIADALIKAFERQGWKTRNHEHGTLVEVEGVSIGVTIKEGTVVENKPLPIDLKSSIYAFHYNRYETVRKPTGRLAIVLHDTGRWYAGGGRTWNDTDKHPIESRLDSVFGGVEKWVDDVIQERLRREEVARRERERELRLAAERQEHARQLAVAREAQARLRQALESEKKRVDDLLEQANRWGVSQTLRLFISHARDVGTLEELGLEGDALQAWARWAEEQADRFDPFVASPQSVLDDQEKIEHMCDHLTRQ